MLDKYTEVVHVNELLTMHMGPDFILVNCSIDFRDDLSAVELESTITRLDAEIKQLYPNVKRVFIEAESRFAGHIERPVA